MYRGLALLGTVVVAAWLTAAVVLMIRPAAAGASWLPKSRQQVSAVAHDLPADWQPLHQGGVDTSTGIYTRDDEDLALPRTPPYVLKRTYLSGDRVSRQFGVGAAHNGEWYLIGDAQAFSWAELILPDGRIRFSRTSPGTSYRDAIFEHHSSPSEFHDTELAWSGQDWLLRFPNRTVTRFYGCSPRDPRSCAILDTRDDHGHLTEFLRNAAGRLEQIKSGDQTIAFAYDAKNRVAKLRASTGKSVDYSYDTNGRLTRAESSDGAVFLYSYDDRDRMVAIQEPARFIENRFDADDRLVWQKTTWHGRPVDARPADTWTMTFAYRVVNQQVVETRIVESGGADTLYRFDEAHYMTTEIINPDGPQPITVSYDRDPVGHFARRVSVWCEVAGRRKSANADVSGDAEETAHALVNDTCSRR